MDGCGNDIKEVLERMGDGDGEAFAEVYRRYAGKCAGFVLALTGDKEAAKDITHDVFVKVWLRRGSFREIQSFESYLLKIARNLVLDRLARQKVNDRYLHGSRLLQDGLSDDVEERMDELEVLRTVRRCIRSMPPKRRQIFIMSRIQGVPNPQIAALLGLSVRTVEAHISLALAGLRKALGYKS